MNLPPYLPLYDLGCQLFISSFDCAGISTLDHSLDQFKDMEFPQTRGRGPNGYVTIHL